MGSSAALEPFLFGNCRKQIFAGLKKLSPTELSRAFFACPVAKGGVKYHQSHRHNGQQWAPAIIRIGLLAGWGQECLTQWV